jgi:acetyl/propionyl-CoA carboxylase alpha subunit/acetyl-CoA carboxylase carboxyltransferase component
MASLSRILVANRGEIAVRVIQTARAMGIHSVAVAAQDDLTSGHVFAADSLVELDGVGPAAYLDRDQLIGIALRHGVDGVHPGYGFLSESDLFAQQCLDNGLIWVGPHPDTIQQLGDKVHARQLATGLGIPVLEGTSGPTSVEEAFAFAARLGGDASVMIKAVAGGGGRGMRPVRPGDDLALALRDCSAEAAASFGNGAVYVERYLDAAHHIEVQIVGDGTGAVRHLWDRDCSIQRRRQKLIEVAPASHLHPALREQMFNYATTLAAATKYRGVGTVEFLVQAEHIAFIEVNPRIQVEHTVTEEILSIDVVEIQLAIAQGATMSDLEPGLRQEPRGLCIEARVVAESTDVHGSLQPGLGSVDGLHLPTGRGIRCDTHAYAGMPVGPRYDSLLAKVIVYAADTSRTMAGQRLALALEEMEIVGVPTNVDMLHAIVLHPEFLSANADTHFVESHLAELSDHKRPRRSALSAEFGDRPAPPAEGKPHDPAQLGALLAAQPGSVIHAPMAGAVISIEAQEGQRLAFNADVIVIEAMKMQNVVRSEQAGTLGRLLVRRGDIVRAGQLLATFTPDEEQAPTHAEDLELDLDAMRPEAVELADRKFLTSDEGRPEAVAKRHAGGLPTAREAIELLCDGESFAEYGALLLPAQRRTRPTEELTRRAPADGLVAGVGRVSGEPTVILAYDYSVMAGTQGMRSQQKLRRLIELAGAETLPVVMFVEGGGGRPNDTDVAELTRLDETVFSRLAALSGRVPILSIVSGRSFAGNAALAALSDIVVSLRDASLGMAGPAMIEAAGLGSFDPNDVGPAPMHARNGVVDVLVDDVEAAIAAARKYLDMLTHRHVSAGDCPDQRRLRHAVPTNRLRSFDMRRVAATIVDAGTLLEVQAEHAPGLVTALARVEGHSIAILGNDSQHQGGAIDHLAATKAAHFLRWCSMFELPVVSLVDTPGFMIGPHAEQAGSVRAYGAMMRAGANSASPHIAIVVRKYYGLGAMAMTSGHLLASLQTVAWPTAEFGGMGLEGAVRLSYRQELLNIADESERQRRFDQHVEALYQKGKALSVVSVGEIDDVIDPADTRSVIVRALEMTARLRRTARPTTASRMSPGGADSP